MITKESMLGAGMKIVENDSYSLDSWNGRMLCFEAPIAGEVYVAGVDPAEGVRGDRSCMQVIKLGNMVHPALQVAEFTCDFLDPVDFAAVIKYIGEFYADSDGTECFCTIETNAPCGDTMVSDLRLRLDYTNLYIRKSLDRINGLYTNTFGWSTNKSTRPKLIARGLHAMNYGDLIVQSSYLLDEMSDFKRDKFDEKPEARRGKHDDRLMSLLLAYYGGNEDQWLSGDDIDEQRRAQLRVDALVDTINEVQTPVAVRRRTVDYQSRPMTHRQMQDEAENYLFGDD